MASARRTYVLEDDLVPSNSCDIDAAISAGDSAALINSIRHSIVGEFDAIPSPLGPRKLTYVDHTASGRLVGFLERYLLEEVAPIYGNTHTTTSYTGFSSHCFLSEARAIMRESVNASERDDCVLFTGRGATDAANVLAHYLAAKRLDAAHGTRQVSFECPFPGCGRGFGTRADAQLHARTHPDGEQAAHNIKETALAGTSGDTVHVVVGPWVHHSSLLPWREAGSHVSLHLLKQDGMRDETPGQAWSAGFLRELHVKLCQIRADSTAESRRRIVCVFAAASNVTGSLLPPDVIDAACAVSHAHGAVTVWDYAAAAPHVGPIDMNSRRKISLSDALQLDGLADGFDLGGLDPRTGHSTVKHGLYFSGHKLTGGPGAPGVLVMKRALMRSAGSDSGSSGTVPHAPGGGTVFFVQPDGTPRYLANDEEREEAGSPDTLGAVRGALAMHLARGVGWASIAARESAMADVARRAWAAHPNIRVVGSAPGPRTPVVSFVVAASGGLLHHWGLIAALLNDLFGIQARGGCLCAGPFVQRLLGYGAAELEALEVALLGKDELLRPGVVRVSFPFTMSHASFRHVVRAVLWVASNASALLPLYQPVAETGEWRLHRSAAGSAVAEGYRISAPASIAVPVRGAASMSPRELIAAATRGRSPSAGGSAVAAADHAASAQRGSFKSHPRRWLQETRFDAQSELPSWPTRRMTVSVGDVASAEQSAATVPEASLYAAYEAEAQLLVDGLAASSVPASASTSSSSAPVSAAVSAQYHSPSSLLSPAGQPLRWFALAGDVKDAGSGAAASGGSIGYVARVDRWSPTAFPAQSLLGAGGYWLSPPADAVSTLSSDTPSTAQLAAWDGVACGSASQRVIDPLVSVPELRAASAAAPIRQTAADSQRAGKKRGPPSSRTAEQDGEGALSASSSSGGPPPAKRASVELSAASASERPHAASVSSAASSSSQAIGGVSALRRDPARIAAIKATCAVIAKMPPPPPALSRALTKAMARAVKDFDMIREGDKLMVGLSGGKDSLTLLILLAGLRARAPVSFDLAAATVDPQYPGFDPSPLKEFCAGLGIPYHYESQAIIEAASTHMTNDSICAWCSRMKRGILYSTMRRNGYNVLVLGQHLDDCAESFLMSAMRNGLLRTMKAHYVCDEGDLRIIRPLVYARERLTREFATACALPIINEKCVLDFAGSNHRTDYRLLLLPIYPSL